MAKPATFKTVEYFDDPPTTEDDMKGLVELRILAGAIRSSYVKDADPTKKRWILTTEWNVIGGNG